MIKNLLFIIVPILLFACGNETEEITDPLTGVVLEKYEYYKDDKGQKIKDGELIVWNKNGDLRRTSQYVDGKLEGEEVFYKSKDTIYFNYYKDNLLEGECRLENGEGKIVNQFSYKQGELDGISLCNYPDGSKNIIGNFSGGLPVGKWQYFDKDGSKKAELNLVDFVPKEFVGKWNIDHLDLASFEITKDAKVSLYGPMFKYSREATLLREGDLLFGREILFSMGSGPYGVTFLFKVLSLKGGVLKLYNIKTEETWTLTKVDK